MRLLIALLAALLAALPAPYPAAAASPAEDVDRYLRIFSGDAKLHSDAADSFAWMGLSDTRLFDVVEKRLMQDYEAARADRNEKNRVARYIRALGFSGQAQYAATLTNFTSDRDYSRYARGALEDLPLYAKWNPVISNRAWFDPKYSDDVNRVMNMLRSEDYLLKRVGAKRVYFAHQDDILLEALAQNVRASMNLNQRSTSDPVAWLVKALGQAKKEKYQPLLEEVAARAADPKVRDYASKALQSRKF